MDRTTDYRIHRATALSALRQLRDMLRAGRQTTAVRLLIKSQRFDMAAARRNREAA